MSSDDTRFLLSIIRQYSKEVAQWLAAIPNPDDPLHRTYGPEVLAGWLVRHAPICYSAARTIASDYSQPYRSRSMVDPT